MILCYNLFMLKCESTSGDKTNVKLKSKNSYI